MKVKIIKGSTKFPRGTVCDVYKIDVEKLGVNDPKLIVDEDDKTEGNAFDADDEDGVDEQNEKSSRQMQQIVRTWFLMASPKNKRFYWLEMDRTELYG